MDPQQLFDSILVNLGYRSGAALARELGRERTSASVWRRRGFPKILHSDLMVLAGKLGRPLPPEFYETTGIPSPQNAHANQCDANG